MVQPLMAGMCPGEHPPGAVRVVRVSRALAPPGGAVLSHGQPAACGLAPPRAAAPPGAREVELPVGSGELSARLSEERALWASCLDEKVGHLVDLMGSLEQRLDGLDRLGGPGFQPAAADYDEELQVESGAHRLSSELSVVSSGREVASSASTGDPHRLEGAGKMGQLSVLDTMCRAVEALQDQNRIHRSEIKALQAQHVEQRDVSNDLARGLESVKEDVRLLQAVPFPLAADLEELRAQLFQNCGDVAALRDKVLGRIEAPATPAPAAGAAADVGVLEVQIEALRAQVSAIGLQQGAIQMQTGHAAQLQQQVIGDLGATKSHLIYNIAALQGEVQRQGGRIGALLQATGLERADPPHVRTDSAPPVDAPPGERRRASRERRSASPERRSASPERRGASPDRRSASPDRRSASPDRRSASPDRRSSASPPRRGVSTERRGASPAGRRGVSPSGRRGASQGRRRRRAVPRAGCAVAVLEDFASNSKGSVLLREGWEGEVVRLDGDGDALIRFEKQHCAEWVVRGNFSKLRVYDPAEEETEVTDDSGDEAATSRLPWTEPTEATELESEAPCGCGLF